MSENRIALITGAADPIGHTVAVELGETHIVPFVSWDKRNNS
jgi:NAD(P)-dependent dehydrogenase (short-subunit alcohol dehydrogenase family)